MDIIDTITPKSDQLNADDLLGGPRTIRITRVSVEKTEQPVSIFFDGDEGKPYKPGKSMRRVLVRLWGTDSSKYLGHRITLYCDESVKFGGQAVGGIRISHASGITEPLTIALTATRGIRKPHVVRPLPKEETTTPDATDALREAAAAGTEALRKAWEQLTPAQKHAHKGLLDELKGVAAEVDQGGAK
jgi:hypothetical protein